MQNEEQQLIVSIRIKENGVTNAMIAEMLSYNNRKNQLPSRRTIT
jgi:hypothetical protein